ncbi:type II toxin-antitoxin system antitoxin SocA domain-containing protein [Levilactobacillus cerevisiae]|uniref:type II toxin-antitoxin system antitoxin SocA domain-containing protein n=1 Tax=Levilactobacillus cerevisiae TaxID=1704076 RepID=UPI000F77F51C|nr:type II toxin-antitoxin system antitoxin SocA domain-containing protein [Levilactobacillus cerevisiae]
MIEESFFKSNKSAAAYLYGHLKNKTPIKIQKGLYFLWAFYAGTYGNLDYSAPSEFQSEKYPRQLFEPNFEAWRYGPVDNEIWKLDKNDELKDYSAAVNGKINSEIQNDVMMFLDDLINQIDDINDFGLVERSHQDQAWKDAFARSNEHDHQPIDAAAIKEDYVAYVKE